MAKERIHWIDIAKGIAILCVFIGHTVSTPSQISSFIYFFHMPAFFFLSGYCFSNRRKHGAFIINKLKTVVLPIFTLGLPGTVIIGLMLQFIKGEAVDWKWTFLTPFVQYGEHSLLWYLAALFVALNLFYGLTKLFKDKLLPLVIASLVLGLASFCFIKFVGTKLPWSVDTALVALPFIAAGYYIKKSEITEKFNRVTVLLISFVICAVAGVLNTEFFEGTEMHTNTYGNILLFYISATAGCIMVMSASMLIKKSKVLEYCGRNSLIFYALEPIQYFANFSLKTLGLNEIENFAISIFITVITVVLIALLSSIAAVIINKLLPFLIGKKYEIKGELQ